MSMFRKFAARSTRIKLLLLCLAWHFTSAQSTIKFRKDRDAVIFFKKGAASDSIASGDEFYFLVNDSLQPFISIVVENGRLMKSENDSLLKFQYLTGMRYETFFRQRKDVEDSVVYELHTLPDGATQSRTGQVRITITDKKKRQLLIENLFQIRRKD